MVKVLSCNGCCSSHPDVLLELTHAKREVGGLAGDEVPDVFGEKDEAWIAWLVERSMICWAKDNCIGKAISIDETDETALR